MQLPSPTIHRFQPLRSGLINLFKYQDQEFWYDHGRLLIRGNNGTGKSRVLALQLPFLLDGEISPRRVEPDGDPARQIAWHLLMDEHDQRTGYTWIEFGRIDENGTPQFVTLGCGMRAIRGGDNQPTRWFFITDRRIGPDFSLLHKNHPLTAESLAEIIGDDCLYKVARDYRAAIDRRLFGIGPDRYAALIELLIRLRAPQLSKKIEADKLYAALSDALPPLSSDIVEKVATAFKDLDELRDQHKKLNTLSNELSRFQSGYQTYLQAALLRRAATLRSCHSDYEHAQRNVAEIERNLQQAKLDETTARDAITPANEKYTIADAHFEALLKSPRAQDAQTLDYAKRTATNAESHSENAGIQATAAARRIEKLDTEIEEHDTRHAHHTQNLATAAREATRLATPAGFATNHARLIPDTTWPTEPAQISKLKLAHEKASAEHLRRLDQLDARRARLDAAQAALTIAQTEENRLAAAIETHGETITTHDTTARTAVRQLADNYTTWRNALRWLAPPPWSQLSPSIDDWLETADNTHRLLAKTIATAAQAEATAHARAENGLQNRQRTLADERELLTTELKLLSAGPPHPPPR
ncbi:MAG: hypothetical protein LBK99_14955, partial [Opitutaceae bacterium]|nr:hypothetical protein [Opitutaceae bacterium]